MAPPLQRHHPSTTKTKTTNLCYDLGEGRVQLYLVCTFSTKWFKMTPNDFILFPDDFIIIPYDPKTIMKDSQIFQEDSQMVLYDNQMILDDPQTSISDFQIVPDDS